ncbi:lipolysis-stimulated lipoprotein receptor-like [Coturnix japonica]|uniref:lipolysis-stimulated lipoprotein receptor-like n=1 Tax=Coturnix japonica TaxID=93934 RepID=UPI0007777066|nr:lipolysis-stimulated lipoprotein receptor-like [Coturnix japonica]
MGDLGQWMAAPIESIQVTVLDPHVTALLFQPIQLRCSYQSSATAPPIVTWKYKSFCPTTSGFGGGGGAFQNGGGLVQNGGAQSEAMEAAIACPDSARTVRIVATKQGSAVSVGDYYQGRGVTITDGRDTA